MKRFFSILVALVLLLFGALITVIVKHKASSKPIQEVQHTLPRPNLLKYSFRSSSWGGNVPTLPPYEKTINNPIAVQKLYDAILTLAPMPKYPPGYTTSCLFGGYPIPNFKLNFLYNDTLILKAKVTLYHPCPPGSWVEVEGRSPHAFQMDETFFSLFKNTLGITNDALQGKR